MYDYNHANGDIKFTKPYIARRGWRAAATVDNIHVNVFDPFSQPFNTYDCPEDLKELMLDLGVNRPSEAMNFWLELNCDGRWDRIGKYKIEFEFAVDAMAYKLTWL